MTTLDTLGQLSPCCRAVGELGSGQVRGFQKKGPSEMGFERACELVPGEEGWAGILASNNTNN